MPFPGEQRLAEPRLVLGDDGVGGGEDMAGRAEILLEANVDCIREVASETADEGDVGPAPTVDRLVVVADDEHASSVGRQRLQPCYCAKLTS